MAFEFVAVGGFAALLYGAERARKDIDLCVAWSNENLERVAAALRELDARLKVGSHIQVPIDAPLLARMEVATLDDIIRSKEIADRPADRAALPELRRLRNREST